MLTYTLHSLPFFGAHTHILVVSHSTSFSMQHSSKVIFKWNQIILLAATFGTIFILSMQHFVSYVFVVVVVVACALLFTPHKQATAYFVVLVVISANVFSSHFINTFSVPSSSFSFLIPIKSDAISRPHLIIINVHVFSMPSLSRARSLPFAQLFSRSLFTCIQKIGENATEKKGSYFVCAFKTFVVQKFQKKICKWFHFDTVAFASIHIQLNGIFVHTVRTP